MNLVVLSRLEQILCGIYLIVSYNFFVNRPLCYIRVIPCQVIQNYVSEREQNP